MKRAPDGLGFVVAAWLIWPKRLAETRGAPDPLDRQTFGFCSNAFRKLLAEKHRSMKYDDIEAITEMLAEDVVNARASNTSVLAFLYRRCLADAGIAITFPSRVPQIECNATSFIDWIALTDTFDPDILACLELAQTFHEIGRRPSDDELATMLRSWPTVFSFADRDLARLCGRGVTDLHIHFTSLWPSALSWLRLLPGAAAPPERLRFDQFRGMPPKDSAAYACLRQILAPEPWQQPRTPSLTRERRISPFFDRVGEKLVPADVGHILASERLLLTDAWYRVLAAGPDGAALEGEIDAYSVAKSIFRQQALQPLIDTNKGLIAFDEARRVNSRIGSFVKEETAGGGISYARYVRNKAFLNLALQDSGILKSAEVRIAPPSVRPKHMAKGYRNTFKCNDRLLDTIDETHRERHASSRRPDPPALKVGLHFKRAIATNPKVLASDRKRGRPVTSGLLRKLLEFDTETATFHDYRLRMFEGQPTFSGLPQHEFEAKAFSRFSRLDLASPERGVGAGLIAPYIRLLKGDTEAIDALASPRSAAYFPKWSELHRQGRSRLPFGSGRIALTCHAGEDFYTLVDGLWHIDESITSWNLGADDALGHCLALGIDPSRALETIAGVRIPLGVELDSLVWLHQFARRIRWPDYPLLQELRNQILALAREIYTESRFGIGISIATLVEKLSRCVHPVQVPPHLAFHRLDEFVLEEFFAQQSRIDLHLLDVFSSEVATRRDRRRPPVEIHKRLPELLRAVQAHILEVICSKAIVIETNPSSNMRMEGFQGPQDLPIIDLLTTAKHRPRVVVCTDNPGTYDITIGTEYALMYAALLSRFGEARRDEVVDDLERLRRTGHDLFDSFDAGLRR